MNKTFFIVILFLCCITANAQVLADGSLSKAYSLNGMRDIGRKFEKFELKADNNIVYNSDSLLGKITFISFWMESCLPCLVEFKPLDSLFKKYKKNNKFRFLSFTTEKDFQISKIKKSYNFTYPVISIDRVEMSPYNFKMGFPTVVITDEQANVRFIKCGGPTNQSETEQLVFTLYYREIDRLLKKKAAN